MNKHNKKGIGQKFLKASKLYVPRLKRFVSRNVLLNPTSASDTDVLIYFSISASLSARS